jgi:hypothetical protein
MHVDLGRYPQRLFGNTVKSPWFSFLLKINSTLSLLLEREDLIASKSSYHKYGIIFEIIFSTSITMVNYTD